MYEYIIQKSMTEYRGQSQELSLTAGGIASQQIIGIKNIYTGIMDLTSINQRKEIAQHYSWEKQEGQYRCRRKYDVAGLYHNCQTMFDPQNAYDLADEFLLSEAGLVRDTLFFHSYWENFNEQIENITEGSYIPETFNQNTLSSAINMNLKYKVLGPDRFRQELVNSRAMGKNPVTIRDSRGNLVENGEDRFLEIMDRLNHNLELVSKDIRTQPLYYKAINNLTYQTNQKMHRLGVEKGLAEVAAGFYVIPAVATIAGGIKALAMELSTPSQSPVIQAIIREPIIPKPYKPVEEKPSPKISPPRILRAIDNVFYGGATGRLEIARTSDGLFRATLIYFSGRRIETFDLEEAQFLETLARQFNVRPGQKMNTNLGIPESCTIPIADQYIKHYK